VAQVLRKPDALPVTHATPLRHWKKLKTLTSTTQNHWLS